jgi:hypothetical protein
MISSKDEILFDTIVVVITVAIIIIVDVAYGLVARQRSLNKQLYNGR